MKKICHLTSVHPPLDTRIFFKECQSLKDAGYDVSLIAPCSGDHPDQVTKNGIILIPFIKYKNRFKRILLSPFRMFSLARKQNADVYHYHDPELMITGLLLRLFTKAAVIYDIHEDYSKNFLDKPWIKYKFIRAVAARMFYWIEKTSCRFMSANIVVLPHWLDKYPKAVLVRNYPLSENLDQPKDEHLFVYVGTLGSKRSAIEMTEIFMELEKMIPGIRFKIIGVFMERSVEEKVMKMIQTCPAIEYLGYQPFNEAQKIVVQASYGFVLYSEIKYRENIPAKMYEYLANNVIPIFSSFDDFKYDVENEGWGIGVNPKNPLEAARHLYAILTNADKKQTLRQNMNHYRPMYSWESEKSELLNLYRRLK
ncbi:MAG: glycosyltransferase [Candidatus Omnitrophota bacterium]